jgi:acyl-CoA dehydrogenase
MHYTHLWVYLSSKGPVTSTYGRGYRNYTIFEGTSEIKRLIIARAISGVHIR